MTLHHGEADFTDVFVLLRVRDGEWRIANKAYERRVNTNTPPLVSSRAGAFLNRGDRLARRRA